MKENSLKVVAPKWKKTAWSSTELVVTESIGWEPRVWSLYNDLSILYTITGIHSPPTSVLCLVVL